MTFAKVEGEESLIKDMTTGAVLNPNRRQLQGAKALKRNILNEKQKSKDLESRVGDLESQIELIMKTMNNSLNINYGTTGRNPINGIEATIPSKKKTKQKTQ